MSETEPKPAPEPARTIKVRDFIDVEKAKVDLTYSHANLSGAMVDQAALFAHYGELLAQAARQVDDLQMMLDIAKAKFARKIRDAATAAGEKLSIPVLEAEVMVTPKIIEIRKAINVAKQIEANAKTMVEAFRHRKDMLIQLGAGEREEKKGELRTMVRREAEEATKAAQSRVAALARSSVT